MTRLDLLCQLIDLSSVVTESYLVFDALKKRLLILLVLHSFVCEQICKSEEGVIDKLGLIVVLISVAIYGHLKDIALVIELNNHH